LSPAKTVVPTGATVPLTLAPLENTTVPNASAEAPHAGLINRHDVKIAATISRDRAIEASKEGYRKNTHSLSRRQ
jgi:hypothetical protein